MDTPRCALAPTFSMSSFRSALGMFATGVTVVTTRGSDGVPVGLTANSFNSVSLDPPLILWSLSRAARSLPAFEQGSHYAVNILAASQVDLAKRFASKTADRFSDVAFCDAASGAPKLDGAAAVFECFNRSRYDEGDHVIFVGQVERCAFSSEVAPLIFHGGRYFTELAI